MTHKTYNLMPRLTKVFTAHILRGVLGRQLQDRYHNEVMNMSFNGSYDPAKGHFLRNVHFICHALCI